MQPKYGSTSLCDQNCGVQSGHRQTGSQTDRQKHGQTDRKVKTEGPKNELSNDIFYFKTVIIGGPVNNRSSVLCLITSTRMLSGCKGRQVRQEIAPLVYKPCFPWKITVRFSLT